MKTIIGFDSWTAGTPYFEMLVPELEKLGYRLLLIHIGSWGHDLNRPASEKIGTLEVRDICYYKGLSFFEILDAEKPCAVIFFSTRALAHQAFNRYCQFLGIPTLHTYHGLVTVQAADPAVSQQLYRVSWINVLNIIRMRLHKNLIKIWPVYWKSLLDTRAPISVWIGFMHEIWAKLLLKNIPAPYSASTTAGCVYVESDVSHMARTYHVPVGRIYTVGNPDLTGFGIQEDDLGSWLLSNKKRSKEVIYVDTALIEAGVVFADQDEFIKHIVDTSEVLESQGLVLVVKLHPAHYRNGVSDRLKCQGIALCSNKDFVQRLKYARATLVEPSSAAVIPGLLGMPLLLVQYGKLSDQVYGSVLTSYPLAVPVRDLTEVGILAGSLCNDINYDDVAAWIKENSGPLPAKDMPIRIAKVIDGLCGCALETS